MTKCPDLPRHFTSGIVPPFSCLMRGDELIELAVLRTKQIAPSDFAGASAHESLSLKHFSTRRGYRRESIGP